jgi:hypothetical protein
MFEISGYCQDKEVILVYAGEDEQYFTFVSPEAYRALADWMSFCEKCGEKITADIRVMRNLWDNRITKGKEKR